MSDGTLTHDHPIDHCLALLTNYTKTFTHLLCVVWYGYLIYYSNSHFVLSSLSPRVSVTSITAASISLSWSVPSDSVVTSYEVMWREGATEMTSGSLTTTSYTIQQLESNANYTITVIATNIAGNTESLPIIFLTGNNYGDLVTFFTFVIYTTCRFRLHSSYYWWSSWFELHYGSGRYYSSRSDCLQKSYCSTKEVCYAMWIDIQTHFPMQQQREYIKHY